MTRPHILYFVAFGFGALHLVVPKAAYAREHGFDVSFAFAPGPEVEQVRSLGFPVHEINAVKPIRPAADLVSIIQTYRLLRRVRPDILSTHFAKGGAIGRIAGAAAGVPIVLHSPHGFPFMPGQRNKLTFHAYATIERLLARWTDMITTQTVDDAALAMKLGIRPRHGDPIVIGNGIDLTRFDPTEGPDRSTARGKFGVDNGHAVFTTFSRINEVKGLRDLVEALIGVADLPWTLLHFGPVDDPRLERWMRGRLEHSGLSSRYRFMGVTDDTVTALRATDWFVLPSHIEGMPRSLIEAQAMGVPAIATDIRGSRSIIDAGATGYLVPPHQPALLAQALRDALQMPASRYIEMSTAASARARQRFDEETVKRKLLSVYEAELGISHR